LRQQRQQLEEQRLAEEQKQRQRQQLEEQRLAEEQRQRLVAARQAELRRQEEERAEAEAEAAQRALANVRHLKLRSFLGSIGFKDINERKTKAGLLFSSFWYPLHAAVKANNLEAVELLLLAGANTSVKNSGKLSPMALAVKLNKNNSHKAIITALGERVHDQ